VRVRVFRKCECLLDVWRQFAGSVVGGIFAKSKRDLGAAAAGLGQGGREWAGQKRVYHFEGVSEFGVRRAKVDEQFRTLRIRHHIDRREFGPGQKLWHELVRRSEIREVVRGTC